MKKINWFFGPKEYINSGIYKYSNTFISFFNEKYPGLKIESHYISYSATSLFRKIYQLIILPLKVIFLYRKNTNVFVVESFLLATLFPFFPYKNSIIIIHDYRDFNLTDKNPSFIQKMKNKILLKSYSKISKFKHAIFVSHYTYQKLSESFPNIKKNGIVIENSFKINNSPQEPLNKAAKISFFKKFGVKNDEKIILTVSSEEERKNVPTVIKAAANLPDFTFIKVGKAIIEENRLHNFKYIETHNISNFFFLEDLTENELNTLYKISDIFVFPSSFEGFGRPPIEAQIMKTPVISSSIQVLKNHLKDSVIYLNNEKDSDELVEKINYVMNKSNSLEINSIIEKGYINSKRFDVEKNGIKFYKSLTNY